MEKKNHNHLIYPINYYFGFSLFKIYFFTKKKKKRKLTPFTNYNLEEYFESKTLPNGNTDSTINNEELIDK